MILVREAYTPLGKLVESLTLDDIVGLCGFKGFTIKGDISVNVKFPTTNSTIVRNSTDLALYNNKEIVIIFPIKFIKQVNTINIKTVQIILVDSTVIQFIR